MIGNCKELARAIVKKVLELEAEWDIESTGSFHWDLADKEIAKMLAPHFHTTGEAPTKGD